MNIIEAIKDEKLFRPFLQDKGGDVSSWHNWFAALRALYGISIKGKDKQELARQISGRDAHKLPKAGFKTALFLTGRRCGKSRIAAVVGAYEAALAGHETKLAKGEKGIVAICSPTKPQSRVVKSYLRSIFDAPLLKGEVAGETAEGFTLTNGTRIEILTGDFRSIRGYTLLAAIIDEVAFFGYGEDSKVKSDTELIRAIQPGLATVGGKLIAISSPYARKGWTYETYKKNFGNDAGKILVLNAPSRTLNPTLPQSVVDEALAEDYQSARTEYLAEFRDDVASFIPREVVEALVVPGRIKLPWNPKHRYFAFADLSGGRGDDAALAIAHREKGKVIIDVLRRYKPPFNPYLIVLDMAEEIKLFGLRSVTGDNYSADFVAKAFQNESLVYCQCSKNKSDLYVELLPLLSSAGIALLDDKVLVDQLASLERRTHSGGRDKIDHPPRLHDDLANAVAGAAFLASQKPLKAGALLRSAEESVRLSRSF